MLQLSPSLEFVFKHKKYFLTHDVWKLPYQFLNRIGELLQTNLITDTLENLNRADRMFMEAEQYTWGLAEGRMPELMGPIMNEKVRKGLRLKMLVLESYLPTNALPPAIAQNVELRGLSDIPAIIALTEKEADICFRFIGGKTDYAGFYGNDPIFLSWAKDLFLHYWDKGNRI